MKAGVTAEQRERLVERLEFLAKRPTMCIGTKAAKPKEDRPQQD
jgi:hypothetical protein